jgi:hypothetical protein
MSIHDLCCDLCGRFLTGPSGGVRFVYHPGIPALRDNSGLACAACWEAIERGLDMTAGAVCAMCAEPVSRRESLHIRRFDVPGYVRLCPAHAVSFLNSLRTVQPKLDPATFRFPASGSD